MPIKTPREIVGYLDERVVGQNPAKRALAVAFNKHYVRIALADEPQDDDDEVVVLKSNLFLIGPTGTGKTHIAETSAKLLDVPFTTFTANMLSGTGYVGDDVSDIVKRLFVASGNDVKRTEQGIIYIDEADKITLKVANNTAGRDITGGDVQANLLTMIQGRDVGFSTKPHSREYDTYINTKNIIFIFGGAFTGIEKIIAKRLHGNKTMGFKAPLQSKSELSMTELYAKVEPDDLIEYGMLPEFAGRVPVLVPFAELTRQDLTHILTTTRNSLIRQFAKMAKAQGAKEVTFAPDAINVIVDHALPMKTGARALQSVMEKATQALEFDLPDRVQRGEKTITITGEELEAALGGPLSDSLPQAAHGL